MREPNGEQEFPDCRVRWGEIRHDQPVVGHVHPKGHFMVILGDAVLCLPRGEFRLVDDGMYVFPDEPHSMRLTQGASPARYFCVGDKNFA